MTVDPAELAVHFSAVLLAEKREAVEASEAELATCIRAALRQGVPAIRVAKAAGISKARVYQIRDGRR